LWRGIVRQFESTNLRLPVPPAIWYFDRLLSLMGRVRLWRVYMLFCCRLLWDVVCCGSFCVRHSVAYTRAGREERARLWSRDCKYRGRLGVVRCAICRWVGLRVSEVMLQVHRQGNYSETSRRCKNCVSSERLKRGCVRLHKPHLSRP